MNVTFNVQRFDPDSDNPSTFYEEYEVELEESSTVLDGLIKIREEMDGSLTLRCSCRSAICGSCAMRINGQAGLACNTKLTDATSSPGSPIVVEPMGNLNVVKDLVVDFKPFWEKVHQVEPWLQPKGPQPTEEYIVPDEAMLHLAEVMSCIMCGACVSDCTVLEVDSNFLGPAALAKAYRFVSDPRDGADDSRLQQLNSYGGAWDCTRCMQCIEVCPKSVAPMDRIMALRDKTIEAGYTNTNGARHTIAFTDLVGRSGHLDELKLPLKTFGFTNVKEILKLIPVGIRAQLAGKRPPLFHKNIPGVENVRRIFEKLEKRK